VIEDQIQGAPDLNYDPARGPVKAPWLSWGPYFWSYPDGTPRHFDGLVWTMADAAPDGLHPSLSGLTAATIGETWIDCLWDCVQVVPPRSGVAFVLQDRDGYFGGGRLTCITSPALFQQPRVGPVGVIRRDAVAGVLDHQRQLPRAGQRHGNFLRRSVIAENRAAE
jgi:hypothetical protein